MRQYRRCYARGPRRIAAGDRLAGRTPKAPGAPRYGALSRYPDSAIATRRSSTTAFHTDLQHTRVGFLAAVDLLVDP